MSWRLLFALSLLGVAMGVATVFVLPSDREPYAWFGVFAVSAFLIAKHAPSRYFLHGLLLGVLDGIWVSAAHVALYDSYVVNHAREVAMLSQAPAFGSPQVVMGVAGLVIGVLSGLVLGLLSYLASKIVVSSHSEFAGW